MYLPFVTLTHELHGDRPSLDDLVGSKIRGLSLVLRLLARVEFGAVNQAAAVVDIALCVNLWTGSVFLLGALDDAVLHSARKRDHVGLLGILLEEFSALLARADVRGWPSAGFGHRCPLYLGENLRIRRLGLGWHGLGRRGGSLLRRHFVSNRRGRLKRFKSRRASAGRSTALS